MNQIKGYRGSSTLKKTNQAIEWTDERKAELLKCKEDRKNGATPKQEK